MKKRRVLVIDDEKAIRETLSAILTDEGYAVTSVEPRARRGSGA